ncbi:hypothetical protein [Vibrio crassostreae]|uniref:hypothetical protein n=1 Tax=Vibrio crassostreae TaxID=246167 RepID=UPI0014046242|nr:hypothetical protein [Vibrio crassostreae]
MFPISLIFPLSTLYGLGGRGAEALICTVIFQITLFYFVRIKIPKVSLPYVNHGEAIIVRGSIISVFLIILWLFITGAAFNLNFDLTKVYEYRQVNAELSSFGLFAYINNWVYQIINVFLIAYFYKNKKFKKMLIFVMIQVFFFAVSAHKSILFYPILVIGIGFYFERYKTLSVILFGVIFIIVTSFILYFFFDDVVPASMFIRRVFFIPAMLSDEYFMFFSSNEFVYWSNSILSGLIDYPYDMRMTKLIGYQMGTEASANNGLISSGFAHFGYIGIAIYVLLFCFLIKIIDEFSSDSSMKWLGLALTIVPIRAALISSDLPTTLLTHGLLVSIFILYFLREGNESLTHNHSAPKI